jgi:Tol biopolymer transport system component
MPSGDTLIVASVAGKRPFYLTPEKVRLFQISLSNGEEKKIAELESAYFYNIQLSPDGRHIAYVSRSEGRDNISVIPVASGQARKVTLNTDPRVYFSSLIWSPDGKNIYYGRQTRRSLVSMFDNFR